MFRIMKMDLAAAMKSKTFWGSILACYILYLASDFIIENDKVISVAQCMYEYLTGQRNDENIISFYAVDCAAGSWVTLFAPVVSAFAFIPTFRDEMSSGYLRFRIPRVGKQNYYIAKFLSCSLCGAFVFFLSYFLYVMTALICLPFQASQLQELVGDHVLFLLIIKILKCSIQFLCYGFFWGGFTIAFASFLRNKYLILCIPFMLKYIYSQLLQIWLQDTDAFFQPDGLLFLFQDNATGKILFHLGITILCFTGYLTIMNQRRDCGE